MNYDYVNPQKVQISFGQKMNANNQVIETSTLLNVRCPNEQEAVEIYRMLRLEMPEELGAYTVKQLSTNTPTFHLNAKQEFKREEDYGDCPECGLGLQKKFIRKGPLTGKWFLGCNYPVCRYSKRLD